jgi:hypothetical protein
MRNTVISLVVKTNGKNQVLGVDANIMLKTTLTMGYAYEECIRVVYDMEELHIFVKEVTNFFSYRSWLSY